MQTDAAVQRRALVPAVPQVASDQRLAEQVGAGSEPAFEALFNRHHRPVLAFCRRMLGSQEDAEDATQLTFLAAYHTLARSEPPEALRPWLYGIARHRCLTALRLRRERPFEDLPNGATAEPGSELSTREELRAILTDIARLPADQRAALVLAELGDLPHAEIAQILGCRRAKVKALVFQARASLTAGRVGRETPCAEIRGQLVTLRGGALRRTALHRHLRECASCRAFREEIRSRRRRVLLPVVPTVGLKRAFVAAVLGPGGAGVGETALTSGGLFAAALAAVIFHAGGMGGAGAPRGPADDAGRPVARTAVGVPAGGWPGMSATTRSGWATGEHVTGRRSAACVSTSVIGDHPAEATPPVSSQATDNSSSAVAPDNVDGDDRTPSAAEAAQPSTIPSAGKPPAPSSANTQAQPTKPVAPLGPADTNRQAEPAANAEVAEPSAPSAPAPRGDPAQADPGPPESDRPVMPAPTRQPAGDSAVAATPARPHQVDGRAAPLIPTNASDTPRRDGATSGMPATPREANGRAKPGGPLEGSGRPTFTEGPDPNGRATPAKPPAARDHAAPSEPPRPQTPSGHAGPSEQPHGQTPSRPSPGTGPFQRAQSDAEANPPVPAAASRATDGQATSPKPGGGDAPPRPTNGDGAVVPANAQESSVPGAPAGARDGHQAAGATGAKVVEGSTSAQASHPARSGPPRP
jgi:RNA polymerase sigma factor (sigma-70 family)